MDWEPAAVLPAQAGVDRTATAFRLSARCAPRAGGGGPGVLLVPVALVLCSPRRRGWTAPDGPGFVMTKVLPAQAGVDRAG